MKPLSCCLCSRVLTTNRREEVWWGRRLTRGGVGDDACVATSATFDSEAEIWDRKFTVRARSSASIEDRKVRALRPPFPFPFPFAFAFAFFWRTGTALTRTGFGFKDGVPDFVEASVPRAPGLGASHTSQVLPTLSEYSQLGHTQI